MDLPSTVIKKLTQAGYRSMSDADRSFASQLDSTKRRRAEILRVSIALVLGLIAFVFVVASRLKLNRLDATWIEIESRRKQALSQLASVERQKQEVLAAVSNAALQEKQIKQILSYCREPSDLMMNESIMCVSDVGNKREMNDMLKLSLPKGDHVIEFQMKKLDLKTSEQLDLKQFKIPLTGPAGYFILIDLPQQPGASYRDPRELSLRITSSDPEFETIKKRLLEEPTPPPSSGGTDYFGNDSPAFFPNQYNRLDKEAGGVLLNRMNWSFHPKTSDRFILKFEIRLLSDGPTVIKATDYTAIYTKKPTYIGLGRYELDPQTQSNDP